MKRFTAAALCVVMVFSLCACGSLFGKKNAAEETDSGISVEGIGGTIDRGETPAAEETGKTETVEAESGDAETAAADNGSSETSGAESVPEESAPEVTRQAAQPEGLGGFFKLVEMQGTDGGSRAEVQLLESYGMVLYLNFAPDGTVLLHMFDAAETMGTWNDTQIVIGDDDPVSYVLDGDTLTLRDETLVMILTKTTEAEIKAILTRAENAGFGSEGSGQTPESEGSEFNRPNQPANSGGDSAGSLSGEGVLAEAAEYKIEVTGYTKDPLWGFTIQFRFTNKSDKELMFSIDGGAVNGYRCNLIHETVAAAGKTENASVNLMDMELLKAGISSPDQIVVHFLVYDNQDWKADNILDETLVIYPTGKSAGEIAVPARRTDDDEKTIVDNNLVTVVVLDDEDDDVWGYTLECYLENKTGKDLVFTWEDVTIDGRAVNPLWSEEVLPGTRAYSSLVVSNSKLRDNGIDADDIKEVKFRLKVHDRKTGESIFEENCTYKAD